MIHELIGVNLNRVNIKKGSPVKSTTEDEEVVLSIDTDPFYSQNLYSGYGELAGNLKILVDQLQAKSKNHRNIETIEDMQKILDNYPDFKKESANVYKHVDIFSILSHIVEERKLLDISKLEQSIAVNNNRDEHFSVKYNRIKLYRK